MAKLDEGEYLSTGRAAEVAKVSVSSIIKWVTDGKLRATATVGGHRRIKLGDLSDFLRQYKFAIPEELRPLRLLIVDDYAPLLRALSRSAIAYKGALEVSVIDNGVDALLRLGKDRFDVVVLDVAMQGMDGLQVCRNIRASQELATKLEVILMTGSSDPDLPQKAQEVGALTLIRKPVSFTAIVDVLKTHSFI